MAAPASPPTTKIVGTGPRSHTSGVGYAGRGGPHVSRTKN